MVAQQACQVGETAYQGNTFVWVGAITNQIAQAPGSVNGASVR
jgi:hypothetical protein